MALIHSRCATLITLTVIASVCAAQESDEELTRLSFRGRPVGGASPIDSLPGHVIAPDGRLTLYADYGDVADHSVTLYLVNRTQHRLGFNSLDRDIYVKLEAMVAEDEWERAQRHWSGPICGNSVMIVSLRPGEYFRFAGYFPAQGEERPVRFRVYQDKAFLLPDDAPTIIDLPRWDQLESTPLDLVSNVGTGKVPRGAVEASRADRLTVQFGTFQSVRDLALGTIEPSGPGQDRSSAIQSLARFPTEASLAIVRELLTDADRSISMAAMRALARMGPKLESAEKLYQEMLRSENIQTRTDAFFAFDDLPATPEMVRYAKEQLAHDELPVRVGAMRLLATQCKSDPTVREYINSIYDSPDPKIQSVFETILYPTCINYQERGYKGRFRERHAPPAPEERPKSADSG